MKIPLLLFLAFVTAAGAAITDEPVDDQRLQGELLKFGEARLNAGKATKASDIRAQLDHRRCQIALASVVQKNDSLSAAAARVRPGVAVVGSIFKCKSARAGISTPRAGSSFPATASS